MKNSEAEEIIKAINYIGGNARWLVVRFNNFILNKQKPIRQNYIIGPKKEEDYFGYMNTGFRNVISAIICAFITFVIIAKLCQLLFK